MLGWVRNQSARVAAVLLLSLLTATASQAAPSHADAGHDDHLASAGRTAAPHNESDHELRAHVPSSGAHPLHCLVCHWARTFRPLATPSATIAPAFETRYHVNGAVVPAPRSVAPRQLSLRSPPASPSVA